MNRHNNFHSMRNACLPPAAIFAFLFFAAPLKSEDMYWNDTWKNFQGREFWTTQKADSYPIENAPLPASAPSESDTAYMVNFGKESADAYLDSFDVTVGSLISANGQAVNIYFPSAKNGVSNASFEVKNALKLLVGESGASYLKLGSSTLSTGVLDKVVYKFGSMEIGTSSYDGAAPDSAIVNRLDIGMPSRATYSELAISSDVKIGGYSAASNQQVENWLYLKVDKTSIGGVLQIQSDGGGWSNIRNYQDGAVIEAGGLSSTGQSNISIYNEIESGASSTIVLKNAAGTDYFFEGSISDFGNEHSEKQSSQRLDIIMSGEGTQRIHTFNSREYNGNVLYARQSGTITVKSGRLFFSNSSVKSHLRQGSLVLDGGTFGAESQGSAAYFKTAEFKNGTIAVENHDSLAAFAPDGKIIITESLAKTGAGKIKIDFSNAEGESFNPENYEIPLAEYGTDCSKISDWAEILTAADLTGFSLVETGTEDVFDANSDFAGTGLENAVAVFKWVKGEEGYTLQAAFTQIPEPAAIAATIGLLCLAFAAWRRFK